MPNKMKVNRKIWKRSKFSNFRQFSINRQICKAIAVSTGFTRSSAIFEGPCDAMCKLKPYEMSHKCSSDCILQVLWQANDLWGHRKWHELIGHMIILISGVPVFHHFFDTTTFTVYATDCRRAMPWKVFHFRCKDVTTPVHIFDFIHVKT